MLVVLCLAFPSRNITLVANPNYVGTKPTLQKVTFIMVTDAEADYAAYRNNERDWTLVPDADAQAVRSDSQLSKEAVEYTELITFWLIINNRLGSRVPAPSHNCTSVTPQLPLTSRARSLFRRS